MPITAWLKNHVAQVNEHWTTVSNLKHRMELDNDAPLPRSMKLLIRVPRLKGLMRDRVYGYTYTTFYTSSPPFELSGEEEVIVLSFKP